MLFEESLRTLVYSDLLHQEGDGEPITDAGLSERVHAAMGGMQAGPLATNVPYTSRPPAALRRLARLQPATLAVMHGSSVACDGAAALRGLDAITRDVLLRPPSDHR